MHYACALFKVGTMKDDAWIGFCHVICALCMCIIQSWNNERACMNRFSSLDLCIMVMVSRRRRSWISAMVTSRRMGRSGAVHNLSQQDWPCFPKRCLSVSLLLQIMLSGSYLRDGIIIVLLYHRLHILQDHCWSGSNNLSLIHIWRCRRIERCRSRWSPYH